MALKIEPGRVVTIAYRILDMKGHVMDTKTPEDPYEFVHGSGQIVAPVERALLGRTPGYRGEIHASPREAYGEYNPGLVTEMPRSDFPARLNLKVGMKFNTHNEHGDKLTVRVIEIDADQVLIDGNHPLAGLELLFEVQVLAVREARSEERESGKVGARPLGKSSDSLH